jgi:DNA-binding transcriptional MerR regulator
MNYSIGDFSAITGISVYMLRYYEKEKLTIER